MASSRGHAARLATLAILCFLAAGCSPRDHTNPFDPKNPDTGGSPQILDAIAGNGRVRLEWSLGAYDDLARLGLTRQGAAGGAILAENLDLASRSFVDTAVTNDSTYTYTLEISFAGEPEPRLSQSPPATPGRRVIWVLDQRVGGPILVSPDGRRQAALAGQGAPSDLDLLASSGEAVAVDFYDRRVDRFDREGQRLAARSLDFSPLAVACVPADSSVWLAGVNPSRLLHLNASLTVVLVTDTTSLGIPEDLAVDPVRGDLWIADSGGRLLHRRPSGVITAVAGLEQPFSVAVDAATGDAWLADRSGGAVYRVDGRADTILVASHDFAGPYALVSDPGDGGTWVTDPAAGRVVHLDAGGGTVAVLTGFRSPAGVGLDPGGAEVWVTDGSRDELLRLGRSGDVRQRLAGFNGPFFVGVVLPPR